MRESRQKEVILEYVSLRAFKLLMRYIYTGILELEPQEDESIVELRQLANLYGYEKLQAALCLYLDGILSADIVFTAFRIANLYSLENLSQSCFSSMDENANGILENDAFLGLSAVELEEILSRIRSARKKSTSSAQLNDGVEGAKEGRTSSIVLGKIRLPLIASPDLDNTVRQSELASLDPLSTILEGEINDRKIVSEYRCFISPETNIATAEFGASVLTGNGFPREALLKFETNRTYAWNHGFTEISLGDADGITVALGKPSLINYIMIRLYDRDHRSYSYYVEVSLNRKNWPRVIDRTRDRYRSVQHLYFEPRVARYIRVVGTRNTENSVFHLVTFQASFTRRSEARY